MDHADNDTSSVSFKMYAGLLYLESVYHYRHDTFSHFFWSFYLQFIQRLRHYARSLIANVTLIKRLFPLGNWPFPRDNSE